MNKGLERLGQEWRRLKPGERKLSVVVAFVCLIAWADASLWTPAMNRMSEARSAAEKAVSDAEKAKLDFTAKSSSSSTSTDEVAKRIERLKEETRGLREKAPLMSSSDGLVFTADVARTAGSSLKGMRSGKGEPASMGLWRHWTELELSSDWDESRRILKALSERWPALSPEAMRLESKDGKRLATTVRWTFLSTDEVWGRTK